MLRDHGILSVEQLSGSIIRELRGSAADTAGVPAAVRYLRRLGIRRQDHAQRIITHITSVYAPDLHSEMQAMAAAATSAGGVPLPQATPRPDVTLCVEGNISAGKSTFLGYITANNEDLQRELGVRFLVGCLDKVLQPQLLPAGCFAAVSSVAVTAAAAGAPSSTAKSAATATLPPGYRSYTSQWTSGSVFPLLVVGHSTCWSSFTPTPLDTHTPFKTMSSCHVLYRYVCGRKKSALSTENAESVD
jgi:hypothetical protein